MADLKQTADSLLRGKTFQINGNHEILLKRI